MEPVYELNGLRIVDLTKVLDPKTESRRCHLIRYNTGGPIPDYHTALDLTSHLGTHCECPYHHFEDGKSVGELPLTTFMGRAIYVNIDFLEPNSHISGADLDRACGNRIHEGDIVILDSNWKFPPFTPETNSPADKRLFINAETAIWMRDHKVKCSDSAMACLSKTAKKMLSPSMISSWRMTVCSLKCLKILNI